MLPDPLVGSGGGGGSGNGNGNGNGNVVNSTNIGTNATDVSGSVGSGVSDVLGTANANCEPRKTTTTATDNDNHNDSKPLITGGSPVTAAASSETHMPLGKAAETLSTMDAPPSPPPMAAATMDFGADTNGFTPAAYAGSKMWFSDVAPPAKAATAATAAGPAATPATPPLPQPPVMMSKAHRNAFKSLKKPPQPHMCIRDRSTDGEELFINVMSWSRIMMPSSPEDPIPLYGGMKVGVVNLEIG